MDKEGHLPVLSRSQEEGAALQEPFVSRTQKGWWGAGSCTAAVFWGTVSDTFQHCHARISVHERLKGSHSAEGVKRCYLGTVAVF